MSAVPFCGWYVIRAGTKGKRRAYWVNADGAHPRPTDVEKETDSEVHGTMRARYESAPWTAERALMVRDEEVSSGIRTG